MKTIIYASLSALIILAVTPVSADSSRHFWEIPDPTLPYIAKVRVSPRSPTGTTVIYNTEICKTIGAACGFFRAHAHAHTQLNHNILAGPEYYPASQEAEADCFAARNIDPAEVQAVVKLLTDENRNPDIPITGDPEARARLIQECAMKVGNWIADR